MQIDVWSDVACPWCWLGKRNLETALRRAGLDAEVTWRAFELDPTPRPAARARDVLARRYGSVAAVASVQERLARMGEDVGLRYDFERQLMAWTFDAHRLLKLADGRGAGDAVLERFFRAYHGEGADLSDGATLRRVAVEAGLDAAEVDAVLAGEAYAQAVRDDEAQARAVGVTGVPFFVLDGRLALAGAQPVEVFEAALRQALRGDEAAEA